MGGTSNLDQMRNLCLGLPGTAEEYPWGHVVWKVGGRVYCITSDPAEYVTVASTLENQAALIADPNISPSSHVGRYGWVTIHLASDEMLEIAKMLTLESYESRVAKLSKKTRIALARS